MTAAPDRAHLRQFAEAATELGAWFVPAELEDVGLFHDTAAFIAAADPQTILALCDALDHADDRLRVEPRFYCETHMCGSCAGCKAAGIKDDNTRLLAERDAARAALDTLADEWEREVDDPGESPRWNEAADLRALLGGDTSALDKRLAEEREQIAQAMEGPPVYRTRNEAGDVMIPLADAQRVARAGGTP